MKTLLWAALALSTAVRADEIAFVNRQGGLFLVPAEGGKPVELAHELERVNDAVFSADGARMVVDGGLGNHHGLWALAPRARAGAPFDRGTDPCWSPDGKRIAYGCFLPFQNGDGEERYFSPGGVCVAGADGGGTKLLAGGRGSVRVRGWTPDGREIVWSELGDGREAFFAIPAAGGAPRPLLAVTFRQMLDPGEVSPDLKRYVWATGGRIHVALLEGAGETSFGAAGLRGAWCRFAPDGARVACAVEMGKRWQLQVYAAAGGEAAVLADGIAAATPLWSPDGAKLVYAGDDGLYVIDAKGGRPLRLFRGGDDDRAIGWIR